MCFGSTSEPPARQARPTAVPRPAGAPRHEQSVAVPTRPSVHSSRTGDSLQQRRYAPSNPSSSGMFYPGSQFAASRTNSTVSGASKASRISVASAQETVRSIRESPSITALARSISLDVGHQEATLDQLKTLHKSRDHSNFKTRDWTPAMFNAWKRYKALGDQHSAANARLTRSLGEIPAGWASAQSARVWPEKHVERATLALQAAEAAVKAAEARIDFMKMYRDAYLLKNYEGHFTQAQSQLLGGKQAIITARSNYVAIWEQAERLGAFSPTRR